MNTPQRFSMHKLALLVALLAPAGAALGGEAAAAPFVHGATDACRFDVADATFIVYGRTPTAQGQELYLQYWAPYYEKADPAALLLRGGFVLAGGVNQLKPERVETVAHQPIYESDGYLLRAVYRGTLGGDLVLLVTAGGGTEKLALGAAGGAYYRTGVVTAEGGVRLRAAPDTAAASSGIIKSGQKVWFTGREVGFIPPDENINSLIIFRKILRGDSKAWIAVDSWREGTYVELGDLEAAP